ncbi:MAG: T9SS type A sorting domain-containing protein [Bacteroidota bacterium]
MKNIYSFLLFLSLLFFVQHNFACDRSSVSLVSFTDNGTSYDYLIEICIGGGVSGVNRGADNATQTIAIALYDPTASATITLDTLSITSDSTGVTLPGMVINMLGAPFNSERVIGYIHSGATDFLCVTSTAGCGNVHTDCFRVGFTSDEFLDSLRVFGAEGAGNPNAGCFPDADMALNLNALLPVEYAYFNGASTDAGVTLSWATASESNSHYFEVERSINNQPFQPIGQVQSAGNSTSLRTYAFTDRPDQVGTYSYRLKQVDLDGKSQFSSVILVNHATPASYIELFPNPVEESLNINLSLQEDAVNVTVDLLDINGKVCKRETLSQAGTSTIGTQALLSGVYIVEIRRLGVVVKREKILKL